jgi:hypothetical protein
MLRNRRVLVAPAWASAQQHFANLSAERDQLKRELFETRRSYNQPAPDLP